MFRIMKDGKVVIIEPVLTPETIERLLVMAFEQNTRIIDMNQKIVDTLINVPDDQNTTDDHDTIDERMRQLRK